MITITDKAIAKLKEFSEAEEIGHLCVRLKVQSGGCAGMSRDMTFDDFIDEMDEVIEVGDIKVIVDPVSFQFLENTSVDYEESQFQSGFKFSTPEVQMSCGCGKSFAY
jgi:iron-sulfur cluster insertion protein